MIEARAGVVQAAGGPVEVHDVVLEPPREDEVLVRLVATGVCHSDAICRDGVYPVPFPLVLGHEGAGIVERVGSGVLDLAVGDHVVMTYSSCGRCRNCLSGIPAYCPEMFGRNFGATRPDGSSGMSLPDSTPVNAHFFGQSSFATHSLANVRNTIRVPDQLPLAQLGPFGCGVQTGAGAVLNALAPQPGQSIVIFGAGSVGLSAVLAARLTGCTRIIAVDLHPARLALALELGATDAVEGGEQAVERILDLVPGGVDLSLEATAIPTVLRQAVDVLAVRGTCAVVGGPALGTEVSVDVNTVLLGRSLRGVVQGDSVPQRFIPALVELHAQGRLPVDRIMSAYPFEQVEQALTDMAAGSTVKPVLRFADV